jgi:hypothetical protein
LKVACVQIRASTGCVRAPLDAVPLRKCNGTSRRGRPWRLFACGQICAKRRPLGEGRPAEVLALKYELGRLFAAISLGLRRALWLGLCVADSFGEHLAKLSLGLCGFALRWLPLGHGQYVGMREAELHPCGRLALALKLRNTRHGSEGDGLMAYFLDLFTPETWQSFHAHGSAVSGFRHRQRKAAEQIQVGDIFCCYHGSECERAHRLPSKQLEKAWGDYYAGFETSMVGNGLLPEYVREGDQPARGVSKAMTSDTKTKTPSVAVKPGRGNWQEVEGKTLNGGRLPRFGLWNLSPWDDLVMHYRMPFPRVIR